MAESPAPRHFRNLLHWQKVQDLAAQIALVVAALPRGSAAEVIGHQLLRSAGSIPANIAEGFGRVSAPAYRNHLSIARGSLFETQSWIDLLLRNGSIGQQLATDLDAQCEELARILTARMKALNATKPAIREEQVEYDA